MIHFSCDRCQCVIDAEIEVRYVVRIEVQAAVEPPETGNDDGQHLVDLQDLIDRMDPAEFEELHQRAYRELKFDLCQSCFQKYELNPLGVDEVKPVGFSDN